MNVRIVEVGPRDGLENERAVIPTEIKVALVDALSSAGYDEIEVSAFLPPRGIPQLADSEEVFRRIRRRGGIRYTAFVPDEPGLERALRARADKIAVLAAASESFSGQNLSASIEESIERIHSVVPRAQVAGVPVRGYIATAFWCPYEGRVDPGTAVRVAEQLLDLGVDELSIGDTIGKAVPIEVHGLLDHLLEAVSQDRVAMHFHDTYGTAVANALAAYERGITIFDASAGGVGGCPFAPGGAGNVATEDLAWALTRSGASVALDLEAVRVASDLLESALGRRLESRVRDAFGAARPSRSRPGS